MKQTSIPVEELQGWCLLNDVKLNGITIKSNIVTLEGASKGGGLVSTTKHDAEQVLLSVPSDLILSKEAVAQHAKASHDFRQLYEALTPFIQTSRKAILVFLLYQMTLCDPGDAKRGLRNTNVFSGYYQALPKNIPLPTFLTEDERKLLQGTSLYDAVEQKLTSLEKEFDQLKQLSSGIKWCHDAWWDENAGTLGFHDWLLADGLYRSRALDLPRVVGDAMVPILDMANHADDDRYNARFEVGEDGNVLLVVRDGKTIHEGDEILINYGAGGASEMLFSYGFLEENVSSAREMFLSLRVPDDDPLRLAKLRYAKEMPGVRVFVDAQSKTRWESAFVWWMCVNEEDGLDFEVLRTTNGEQHLQATWHESPLSAPVLKDTLLADRLKDVFMLRATVTIQQRIEEQGEILASTEESFENLASTCSPADEIYPSITDFRRLREVELELLTDLYQTLELQKQELLQSRIVTEYLLGSQTPYTNRNDENEKEEVAEDFS